MISIRERIRGMLLGFAIGDALGAPAAGLPGDAFCKKFGLICDFLENPLHPYLSHLKLGQYTENTRLLLDSARDYSRYGHYSDQVRKDSLKNWARRINDAPEQARWPGQTTLSGARALIVGTPRPSLNDSIGAAYRCLPIALILDKRAKAVDISNEVLLTHAHPDVIISAEIITEVVQNVLLGNSIVESIKISLKEAKGRLGASSIIEKCISSINDIDDMRRLRAVCGTGAKCNESLPVALAILIRSASSPKECILEAANSFKPGDDERWNVNIADESGGNTDGIAAIVGSIVGACYGGAKLLSLWGSVENVGEIILLADELSMRR